MRELDASAQSTITQAETETIEFIEQLRTLTKEERTARLRSLSTKFREALKHGEDKVALAVQTYDMVDRHIRRLDEDLEKFQDEQMTGPKLVSSSFEIPKARGARMGDKRALAVESGRRAPKRRQTSPEPDSPVEHHPRSSKPKTARNGEYSTREHRELTRPKSRPPIKSNDSKGRDFDSEVDPGEPVYCICRQVSFGEMIGK
ncbi:Inhibitor of growth protein 5 [Nowakowskiella sp. JEL0407]|nr:Inhibitor of growth protein 5 [Nowakowskiella sp. JEL0407]